MKPLKMNWAKTSYLRNGSYGLDSLLSFDCFVPKDLFDIIKSSFQGYVQKDGKKVAVYNTNVVHNLIEKGQGIELDGVSIDQKSLAAKDLLLLCENCNNKKVSNLAKLYREELKQKDFSNNVQKTVNEIFGNKLFKELSKGVKVPEDIKWTTFKINDNEYEIDFNYGVQHYLRWEETSHENFNAYSMYRVIPNKSRLPELKNFLEEAQEFSKKAEISIDAEWLPGFDSSSLESRKKSTPR